MKIARVFPRKTNATPVDEYTFFDAPGMFLPEINEVHVSVAFTYDIPKAEQLAEAWGHIAPVKIGGPAMDEPGGEFIPGMYLKPGYVITSRGCPNNCWFCSVRRREGELRELEIKEGNNVLDDNLLACSPEHFEQVCEMLKQQTFGPVMLTGGLEAARLTDFHIERLLEVKPKEMFFANDTPDDYEPLVFAGKRLKEAGFTNSDHSLRAYVLVGYPKDTFEQAEKRLKQTIQAGFMPMAMLYRNKKGEVAKKWERFQREWANPWIVGTKMREVMANG